MFVRNRNNGDDSDDNLDVDSLRSLHDRSQDYGFDDDSDEYFEPPEYEESESDDGNGGDEEPISKLLSTHNAMNKNEELVESIFKSIKKDHPLKNVYGIVVRQA